MTDPDLNSFECMYFPEASLAAQQPDESWLDVGLIRDVILHTEIIETPDVDLVVSPGQVWLMAHDGAPPVITGEIELNEEQFWQLLRVFLSAEEVAQIRHDVDDVLRWEGEGGSCLN